MSSKSFARSLALFLAVSLWAAPAAGTTFAKGAIIIPMDNTYQGKGILKAYGLLYKLLLADVPVHWVIKVKKKVTDADFKVAATDLKTSAAIPSHGYRGGPFVIQVAHAAKAKKIITAWWQAKHNVTVHLAAAGFTGRTGRLLTAAPSIAVIADKNELIAFKYLNAAAIPDRVGGAWPKKKDKTGKYTGYADVHGISAIAGPTTTSHKDGALFRPSGSPAYCQVMTMHWGVKEVVKEVIEEYRAFLQYPTHMFAECQAVNAVENVGLFLTTKGFDIDNKLSGKYAFLNSDTPFAQMDGGFKVLNGSEKAYSLKAGSKFWDADIVMIKDATTAAAVRTVWMTGYYQGKCKIREGASVCANPVGKISYLGGHEYKTSVPISKEIGTQGTRLFLNSLFEASCASQEGQPHLIVSLTGPAWTTTGLATYTIQVINAGHGPALDAQFSYPLPSGAKFVSASTGGKLASGAVTWNAQDLNYLATSTATVTVKFSSHGTYTSQASMTGKVGLNSKTTQSNKVSTKYLATPDASVLDAAPPDAGAQDGPPVDAGKEAAVPDAPAPDTAASADQTGADSAASADQTGADSAASADGTGAGKEAGSAADTLASSADSGLALSPDDGCDCRAGAGAPAGGPLFLALVLLWAARRFSQSACRKPGAMVSSPAPPPPTP